MPSLERQWTVDDLDDLPDDGNRYEVIDGELFVTPAPAVRHQIAVGELYALLRDYLRHERIGNVLFAPVDVSFSRMRLVQPDLLVVPRFLGEIPNKLEVGQPLLLAVEVLSPSTARADRVAKRTLFRDEGVPEYWIVDLDARTIERSTPAEPRAELVANELMWMPEGATKPLVIDLPAYFAGVVEV